MKISFETDWLSSNPVFYNEKTKKISHSINDVIDFRDFDFHPEGLRNYLEFGYSVFGQTPIKDVKFLDHSSIINLDVNGKISIEKKGDIVEAWPGKTTHEEDVIHFLHSSVESWEKRVSGEILIPTSGGYDSRLLNLLISDRSRIRSFTYGLSTQQEKSYEVIFSQKLSQILGTKFQQIYLGNYHRYIEDWHRLFGISTHTHGMYQIEFYRKIQSIVGENSPLLSGIVGDLWAGSVSPINIDRPCDLHLLGHTHGLKADASQLLLRSSNDLKEKFFEENRFKLKSDLFKIVTLVRLKMILLCYLIKVPEFLDFQPWSPFLEPGIALSMICLAPHRRQDRLWQKDLFRKHGLDFESMNLRASRHNILNKVALKKSPLAPLDITLLREVINPKYVSWINRCLNNPQYFPDIYSNLSRFSRFRSVFSRIRLKDHKMQAYYAHLVLKPIEIYLGKRRDMY